MQVSFLVACPSPELLQLRSQWECPAWSCPALESLMRQQDTDLATEVII